MIRRMTARIAALAVAFSSLALPASAAAPERIIDVVQVSWPGASATSATAAQLANVISTDTIDRWRRMSNGSIEFTLGQTFPSLNVLASLPCDAYGSLMYMTSIRAAVYERAGIGDSSHRFLIILTPKPAVDCIWDGRGLTNSVPSTSGAILLKNNIDAYVVAHELGHNLGLGHSNLERCSNGRPDDIWTNCNAIEYGSATDLMSNNDRDSVLSAYHLWRLGIIENAGVARPRTDQTVTMQPVTSSTGTRAIFIRDNTAAYWIEYRLADPENQIAQGLVIYRADPPPGSSVLSPISSDAADPTNSNVTTDVWMINLGDYSYAPPVSKGSPSLPVGGSFTTAFGGYTVSATANADGSAQVAVRKTVDKTAPAAPKLTDTTTWRTPNAELIDTAYLDAEDDIRTIQARISQSGTERLVTLTPSSINKWTPTYLHPIDPPTNVRFSALPEGSYALALRAVDGAGNTSKWSPSVDVLVDRGRPNITEQVQVSADDATVGSTATVRWTGATDEGAGICDVRTVDQDGFALHRWTSTTAGVPMLRVTEDEPIDAPARVYDCLGNGVSGRLQLQSTFTSAADMQLKGTWRRSGTERVCTRTCTATFRSGPGNTAVLVRQGAGTITVDGKLVRRIPVSKQSSLRVAYRVSGQHSVLISGIGLSLVGAQAAHLQWTPTADVDRAPITLDPSLEDRQQLALSKFGFSQDDFSDDHLVLPMTGGTELEDPSLDWCEATFKSEQLRQLRRQTTVTLREGKQPYTFLSSETVRYTSATAVRQALSELDAADSACRQRGGSTSSTGTLNPYTHLPLPALPTTLRPAEDRRVYLVNTGPADARLCMLIVYQFKNDLMNNLYVVKRGADSLTASDVAHWLRVAGLLATRM